MTGAPRTTLGEPVGRAPRHPSAVVPVGAGPATVELLGAAAGSRRPARADAVDEVRFWGALVLSTGARAVLLFLATLLIGAALPAAWGWVPTAVASGSMAPRIAAGDVVVAMPVPAADVEPGQVLLVEDPDRPGALLLHRLAAVEDDGSLRLRGDANATPDASTVRPEAVRGVGVLRVPLVGLPATWQGGERLVGALLTTLAVLGLLALTRLGPRDDGTVDPLGVGRHRAVPVDEGPHWSAPVRATGVVLAVAAGATALVLVVGSSGAAFSATTTTAAGLATTRFTCFDGPAPTGAHFAYRYDDAVGPTVRDSSGNGRDGTLSGGARVVAGSCASGDSPYLRLDGLSGQVTTSEYVAGPQVFTVETWFRTTTTQGGRLVGFGNSQAAKSSQYDRHLYLTDDGRLVFGVYDTLHYTVESTGTYADGTWHLATATLDASGMHLYVDGVEVASDPQDRAEPFSGWWRIGHDSLGGAWPDQPSGDHYAGDLDDTTVYDRALTAQEVAEHHAAGRAARSGRTG